MEILKGIDAVNKAIWIKKSKTLVLSDLHIGYEEALNKQGILAPRRQFKETEKDLCRIFAEIKKKYGSYPLEIVINGDLKHEFGEISSQEWNETLKIIDLMMKKCSKIILVRGNHDTFLGPIADKRRIKIVNFYKIGEICIVHGDKIVDNDAEILIIGHEHPAITLAEGAKQEKYKCFLLGKWKNKKLIVMPSFLPIIEGSDVKKESLLSPYLNKIKDFEAFVVGDKIYKFGKLKDIHG